MSTLNEDFSNLERQFNNCLAQKELLEKQLDDLLTREKSLISRRDNAEKAKAVIETVALETQQNLEYRVSELVSLALDFVFPGEIVFTATATTRRNQIEFDLKFHEKDNPPYTPLKGSGFGALDISSFALRATYWTLNRNRPVFILDEPFRNVSPDLQTKVSEMLHEFSEKLGVQIIMVSHAEDINFAADKTFRVSRQKGIAKVKED